MANFPAGIRCSTIAPTGGRFYGQRVETLSGNTFDFQGSNRSTGARIRLTFRSISDATVAALRSHWDGEQTTGDWLLSAELLDGLEYASEYTSIRWRYSGPYRFQDYDSLAGGCHDAEVELSQAPVPIYIDTLTLLPRPASIAIGSAVKLIGPDTDPALWVSRLTTTHEVTGNSETGPYGSIRPGLNGESFQVFCFLQATENVRLVLVKRDNRGNVIWQRWTALTTSTQSSRSIRPQVLPLPDGGCVVMFKDNISNAFGPMFLWRFNSSGTVIMSRQYTSEFAGPAGLAVNGAELIAVCLGANARPVLVRIRLSDGALQNARSYSFAGQFDNELPPCGSDCIIALPNGRIVFRTSHTPFFAAPLPLIYGYITEVSADLATVHRSKALTFGFDSRFTRLSDGGYLIVDDNFSLGGRNPTGGPGYGAVRLDSSMQLIGRYSTVFNFPGNASFAAWGDGRHVAIGAGSELSGYSIERDIAGTNLSITKFSNGGASITGWRRIDLGANIGQVFQNRVLADANGVDVANGRGFVHVAFRDIEAGNNVGGCRITAVGFALDQPEGSGNNLATMAATINTLTCSNTMGVRGWDNPSTSSATPVAPTVSDVTTTATAVSLTEAAATLSWSDPGVSLVWATTLRLYG